MRRRRRLMAWLLVVLGMPVGMLPFATATQAAFVDHGTTSHLPLAVYATAQTQLLVSPFGANSAEQALAFNPNSIPCTPARHTILPGESVWSIALQHGVTMDALAQANALDNTNLIYAGQSLALPNCAPPTATPAATGGGTVTHVIQPGENLETIARRYGVSQAAIIQANGISNPNLIYAGQALVIGGGDNAQVTAASAPAPAAGQLVPATTSKRIEVNLSTQQMAAYDGNVLVLQSGVSTGRYGWDTPAGTFKVYQKYPVQTMTGTVSGESWLVPNVPNVMYFYGGDALHGTYWHNKFGTGARLSHGCVNLPLDVAAQLYAWAPVGTTVWVHY